MGVGKEGDKIEWKSNPWRRDGDGMGRGREERGGESWDGMREGSEGMRE